MDDVKAARDKLVTNCKDLAIQHRKAIHSILMILGSTSWILTLIAFMSTDCVAHPGNMLWPRFIELCGDGYDTRLWNWFGSGLRVLAWFIVTLGCFIGNIVYMSLYMKKNSPLEYKTCYGKGVKYNWWMGLCLLVATIAGAEPAITWQIWSVFNEHLLDCRVREYTTGFKCRSLKLFPIILALFVSAFMFSLNFFMVAAYRKALNGPPPDIESPSESSSSESSDEFVSSSEEDTYEPPAQPIPPPPKPKPTPKKEKKKFSFNFNFKKKQTKVRSHHDAFGTPLDDNINVPEPPKPQRPQLPPPPPSYSMFIRAT